MLLRKTPARISQCKTAILLIELESLFELVNGLVSSANCFHAVTAKIVGGVFHVLLGPAQRGDRFTDFRVRLSGIRGGRLWLSC